MILFGAGHVEGEKIWKGYSEDKNMFDLAQRKAKYAAERYGQQTKTFYVTGTSYPAVEAACKGCEIASWEHSDAWTPDPAVNRVSVYRTVLNKGDGPCLLLAQATMELLGNTKAEVKRKVNSSGKDGFGVIGRAMRAGCKDSWLHEHGFHTNDWTRALLSDAAVRQQLAEAEVDVLANYYGWESVDGMRRVLKKTSPTMKGADVIEFQEAANKLINAGLDVDGSYGGASERAAKDLQAFLGVAVDGYVGPATWAAIDAALAVPGPAPNCDEYVRQIARLEADNKDLQTRIITLTNSNNSLQIELLDAVSKYNQVKAALDVLRGV